MKTDKFAAVSGMALMEFSVSFSKLYRRILQPEENYETLIDENVVSGKEALYKKKKTTHTNNIS